jgi:hypothetical protein
MSDRRVIFLFLDGVGLGSDDPVVNPLAAGDSPTLSRLLMGRKPVLSSGRLSTPHAELIPTDAHMGVPGRPQSATGQAALLTGVNASRRLGEHYGPRPDQRVRDILDQGSVFSRLRAAGCSTCFINAYPQRYFDALQRGKRLLSAVPYAVVHGGQSLLTYDDLAAGQALSADFTGEGWRSELGYPEAPVYTPQGAGALLWRVADSHHFTFFEHWLTDVLGHEQALEKAVANFQVFDGFLAGLLAAADLQRTLIIIASDHGNVEDCSHGKHTENPALTLVIGCLKEAFAVGLTALTDFAPRIVDFLALSDDRRAG